MARIWLEFSKGNLLSVTLVPLGYALYHFLNHSTCQTKIWGLNGLEPWSSGYGRRLTFQRSWVRIPAPDIGWTWLLRKKGKKEINKKAIELKKYEFIVKERKRRKKVRYKASVIGLKSSIIFEMPSLTLLHDGWSHRIKINVKRLMLDQAKAAKCNNVAFWPWNWKICCTFSRKVK